MPLATSAERPAGQAQLCLKIADIMTAVCWEGPAAKLRLPPAARPFVAAGVCADVTIRAGWGRLSEQAGGAKVFDSGGVWTLHQQEERWRFQFSSPIFGSVPYKTACFASDFREGDVRLHRPYFESGSIYPLDTT